MPKTLAIVIALIPLILGIAMSASAACGPRPEKGWIEFVDQSHGFCFWYPPAYKRKTDVLAVNFPKDRQVLAELVSSEPRQEQSNTQEPATITIYLFRGAFDLRKLMVDAPTGWNAPGGPKRFGANTFYYYGRGGGGVLYPDMYYLNLRGRALQFLFDGPYGDSNSPTAKAQETEKRILFSFRATP